MAHNMHTPYYCCKQEEERLAEEERERAEREAAEAAAAAAAAVQASDAPASRGKSAAAAEDTAAPYSTNTDEDSQNGASNGSEARLYEPFDMANLRPFLMEPLPRSVGVLECEVVRSRPLIGGTTYKLYYQATKRLLMTAKSEGGGRLTIKIANKKGEQSNVTLGRVKSIVESKQYVIIGDDLDDPNK
jgi:hypothetical protein